MFSKPAGYHNQDVDEEATKQFKQSSGTSVSQSLAMNKNICGGKNTQRTLFGEVVKNKYRRDMDKLEENKRKGKERKKKREEKKKKRKREQATFATVAKESECPSNCTCQATIVIWVTHVATLLDKNSFKRPLDAIWSIIAQILKKDPNWTNTDLIDQIELLTENGRRRRFMKNVSKVSSNATTVIGDTKTCENYDDLNKVIKRINNSRKFTIQEKRAIRSEIRMGVGRHAENIHLSGIGARGRQKAMNLWLEDKVLLTGKIDALNDNGTPDGAVMEVKKRTTDKSYGRMFENERIQINSYIGLRKETRNIEPATAIHRQIRKGYPIIDTEVKFNERDWNESKKVCLEAAQAIREKLYNIVHSNSLKDVAMIPAPGDTSTTQKKKKKKKKQKVERSGRDDSDDDDNEPTNQWKRDVPKAASTRFK